MNICELLEMLKWQLELITDYMDEDAKTAKHEELTVYINSAIEFITREGIVLDYETYGDKMLVTLYAAWLYSKRNTTPTSYNGEVGMPRSLRYNLNNRLFQQKVNDNAT